MAEKDFYDIKGLGELPSEQTASAPTPYRPSRSPGKTKHTVRNILIVFAVLVVLSALGGGAYWFLKHHKSSLTPKPSPSTATSTPTPPSPATPTSTATMHYISNGKDLNLEFDYPSNWTVTPTTGNNTKDQAITVNSPSVTIADASGASATGKATITLRPGTATLDELNFGTPVAAQDSLQIAYAQPTAVQHQYTYLTFVHFSTASSAAGAFEEVMVTGIQQFKKGTPVTTTALANLDPIIAINFYRCGTSDCSGKGAGNLSINDATWQNNGYVQQVQGVIKSLKLK